MACFRVPRMGVHPLPRLTLWSGRLCHPHCAGSPFFPPVPPTTSVPLGGLSLRDEVASNELTRSGKYQFSGSLTAFRSVQRSVCGSLRGVTARGAKGNPLLWAAAFSGSAAGLGDSAPVVVSTVPPTTSVPLAILLVLEAAAPLSFVIKSCGSCLPEANLAMSLCARQYLRDNPLPLPPTVSAGTTAQPPCSICMHV